MCMLRGFGLITMIALCVALQGCKPIPIPGPSLVIGNANGKVWSTAKIDEQITGNLLKNAAGELGNWIAQLKANAQAIQKYVEEANVALANQNKMVDDLKTEANNAKRDLVVEKDHWFGYKLRMAVVKIGIITGVYLGIAVGLGVWGGPLGLKVYKWMILPFTLCLNWVVRKFGPKQVEAQ